MATINDKSIVDNIIANNGIYKDGDEGPEDPAVVKIVEYRTNWGGIAYGLVYELDPPGSHNRYERSANCHNARVIFRRKDPDLVHQDDQDHTLRRLASGNPDLYRDMKRGK